MACIQNFVDAQYFSASFASWKVAFFFIRCFSVNVFGAHLIWSKRYMKSWSNKLTRTHQYEKTIAINIASAVVDRYRCIYGQSLLDWKQWTHTREQDKWRAIQRRCVCVCLCAFGVPESRSFYGRVNRANAWQCINRTKSTIFNVSNKMVK